MAGKVQSGQITEQEKKNMTTNTATQTREIRVFLSSTFRDMDAERTYLVKQVFPKVRAACLERQVGFSEIDLRWGVSEEESKNGATVEICLKEIDRCRDFPPFFIGFLGERYGWIPKHDELAAYWDKHGDSQYAPAIRDSIERGISVTELEMELAVLGEGAADKMAGHALFLLRAPQLTDQLYRQATGHDPDHNDTSYYDAANGRLANLKQRIRHTPYLGIDNYTSIEQFGAAVESYLIAQLDRYFPADEVPTPFERSNAAHQAFRFHRLQNFLPRPDVREQMIRAIEQRIETPALGPILVTGPSGQGKSALMADLARHLQHQPVASQPEASQPLPPHRGKVGMGVSNPIETTNALAGTNPSTPTPTLPLPGGGSEKKAETWRVIDHYIGADSANYLESWVERILQTLHPDIQDIAGDIPETPKDKIEALSTWISMAARRNHCRYLFILDALDQLSDGGKNLDILTPQTLGPDGILIASAADDTPARRTTKDWNTILEVPPLTDQLRHQIVTDTLARYRKVLPADLANRLASAPQSGSPLYLGLALEELRVDARHENLAQLIDDILKQPDAEQLFLNNFLLDADNGRPELPELAASFMALLGASRAGLSEIELADLLAQPDDPIAEDTGKPRLPQVHLSRLLNNLAPFLLNKQGRRAPMHRIFGEAALHYYDTWPVREHLYAHFAPGYGKGDNEYDDRAAAEALHQVTELARLEHKGQKQARIQLVLDLGYLSIPVKLYDDESNGGEKLLLDAMNVLDETEQVQIQQAWKAEIAKLNAIGVERAGSSIRKFGNWLEYWARYGFALAVLEPLLCRQETLLLEDHDEIANTSNSLGSSYVTLARFDEAMPLLKRALAIWEKAHGSEYPDTALVINNLAGLLQDLGDYAGAEPLLRRALAIREKVLGPDHPSTANSLNNLASLLNSQGDYTAAEPLYRHALAICEKARGPDHPHTAISLDNLAGLLRAMGDYVGAEPLHQRALAICEKALGPEHPSTATSISALAILLCDQGDYVGAEPLHRRALAIREKTFGPDHPRTAISLDNLAGLLRAMGDYVGAEPLHQRALAICEKALGPEHPSTATSINNLAVLMYTQSDYAGAEPLFRRALVIREKALGPNHPDTATSLDNLARLLIDTDNTAAAVQLYRRALAIQEKSLDLEHLETARILNNLSALLYGMGDTTAAEPLIRQAVAIREKSLGLDHQDTVNSLGNLAELLETKGDIDESAELRFKQLAILERAAGIENEKVLRVLQNLAVLLRNSGKLEEAESLQRESVARHVKVYGEDGLETAAAYSGLGALLKLKKEFAEAESCYRKALAIRERKLGADAEPTKLVRKRLDELLNGKKTHGRK